MLGRGCLGNMSRSSIRAEVPVFLLLLFFKLYFIFICGHVSVCISALCVGVPTKAEEGLLQVIVSCPVWVRESLSKAALLDCVPSHFR